MVICPDCGNEVPDAKFCKNCGSRLPEVSKTSVEIEDADSEVSEVPVEKEEVSKFSLEIEENEPADEKEDVPVEETKSVDVEEAVTVVETEDNKQSSSGPKFCYNCGYELNGTFRFCPNCGYDLENKTGVKPSSNNYSVTSVEEKNIIVSIILSVIFPGLGHFYLNLNRKGAIFLIAYVVSAILILLLIGFILVWIVWIWALVDVIKSTNALNRGEVVEDKLF